MEHQRVQKIKLVLKNGYIKSPKVFGLAVNENLQLHTHWNILGKRDKTGICENILSQCDQIRLNLIKKVKFSKKSFKRIFCFTMNIHLSNMNSVMVK